MSIFEYDERQEKKKLLQTERKYARLEGIEEGRQQGIALGMIKIGRRAGWNDEQILETLQNELTISREEAQRYFAQM